MWICRYHRVAGVSSYRYLSTTRRVWQTGNSPLKVFRETFKKEWAKSQELQDNIKTLQDASGKLGESDAYKKAREAFLKAHQGSTLVGKSLKKTSETMEQMAKKAWESEISQKSRKVAVDTAKKIDDTLEPVRQTKIYKDVSDVIDDGNETMYGGFITKEERNRRREEALRRGERVRAVKGNDQAGTAVVATNHQPRASLGRKLQDWQEGSTMGKWWRRAKTAVWDENENPLVVFLRRVTGKLQGAFAETEAGRVYAQFKLMDPHFNSASFTKHLREYVVPELLEAYATGNETVLKRWFSEAPFNVYKAQNKALRDNNLRSDGRILDIRGVEIVTAKMLPGQDLPVLVVGCRAQELQTFRKRDTGDIAAGGDDHIVMSSYALVFARDAERMDDEETEGWKVLEFVRGGSRPFN